MTIVSVKCEKFPLMLAMIIRKLCMFECTKSFLFTKLMCMYLSFFFTISLIHLYIYFFFIFYFVVFYMTVTEGGPREVCETETFK